VERLRASNDALSREAEEERTRAVAAKAAELEARERAVRDAEERSEKVRAAAEALEAAELRRRLAEDEAARLRKTTPEREKGSDIAVAELRVLAETHAKRAATDGSGSSGEPSNPGEARRGDGTGWDGMGRDWMTPFVYCFSFVFLISFVRFLEGWID